MKLANRFAYVLATLGLTAMAPVACGDGDSSSIDASGGSGAAGSSGKAGSAGKGGETSGGGGETSGGGGETSGGGGETSGGGGETSGGGGESSGPTATVCQEECQETDDCLGDHTCENGRCVAPPSCSEDDQCVASASGWNNECSEDGDCLPTQSCVDIGEENGRCANEPTGLGCEDIGMEEIEQPRMEGGNATVCGNPNSACSSGTCVTPCSEDSCPENFECNPETGQCDCSNDDACADVPNTSVCVEGRCQCADDGDCEGSTNKCFAGTCGCTEASVCEGDTSHPGTEWVCEGI